MELETIAIENPDELNFILGHAHFIKTVEDVYEAIIGTVLMQRSVLHSVKHPWNASFATVVLMKRSSNWPKRGKRHIRCCRRICIKRD